MAEGRPASVAVIGGGITGLAAAWELARRAGGPGVVVYEADQRLGGKIRTDAFADQVVEAGPDAFLARVPHAIELCRELGLADELVAPGAGRAYLWTRGRVRGLPEGLVLGVPSDLVGLALSGVLSPLGLARAALDLVLPAAPHQPEEGDLSVGALVARRFGREAAERLVDPLLGGIHAGTIDRLSAAATAPQLLAALAGRRSLLAGLRGQLAEQHQAEAAAAGGAAAGGGRPAPVFLTPAAGLGRLVDSLRQALVASGVALRTGTPVTELGRADGGWMVATGGGVGAFDAVVVTTPAPAAAALLAQAVPAAASELAAIEHASVVMATLGWPSAQAPGPPGGSGLLTPRVDGHLMTACSWYTAKWPHTAHGGLSVLRVSAGRAGDGRAMAMDDAELVAGLRSELRDALDITAAPAAVRVTRWPDGFPQYTPGHLARVERIERAVRAHPGLAVAGAPYRGVGIPACIASGREAARAVLEGLAGAGRAAPSARSG